MTVLGRTGAVTLTACMLLAACAASPRPSPPVGGSPEPVAAVARGSVVETMPLDPALWPDGTAAATRVVHRTVDSRGAERTASGSVFLPAGTPPADGRPVISYAHGTVGLADECAPSALGLRGDEAAHVTGWLRRGHAVVVADYIGLGTPGDHPYLDGVAAGNAVIDIVRAARAVVPDLGTRWIASGLSQGGHAAVFAGLLAPRVAPELDLRGVVATGLPVGVEHAFGLVRPESAGRIEPGVLLFGLYLLSGLDAARPDARPLDHLTDVGRALVARARVTCAGPFIDELGAHAGGHRTGDVFVNSPAPLGPVLAGYVAVPVAGLRVPVLLGQGTDDLVTPAAVVRGHADAMRAAGQDVTYVELPGVGHGDSVAAVLPAAYTFSDRVLSKAVG